MKRYARLLPYLFLTLLLLIIFKAWFMPGLITAGDLWPYSNLIYSSRSMSLFAWDLNNGVGLGAFVGPLLWIYLNFGAPVTLLGIFLGLGWSIIERIWYLYPFFLLGFVSCYKLFSKLFSKNIFTLLSSAIFMLNSYILMVVGGGQIQGIGMAYSLIPLIVLCFLQVIEATENKKLVYKSNIAGIILATQFIFDIRIAYITLVILFILWSFSGFKNIAAAIKSSIFVFLVPGIVVFLLNSFWIIPTIANHKNPVEQLGPAYSSLAAVKFFSFAKFEDTVSLLHPNWPENVFGKVDFLKPEFLLLPILAFTSLLFLKKETLQKRKFVIFFSILGLLGAFLAKGANDPFGSLYLFLFSHFPGFILFRDPTKWYILTALSYSMLIPFSVEKIYEFLKQKFK